jgi:hypothetical protein
MDSPIDAATPDAIANPRSAAPPGEQRGTNHRRPDPLPIGIAAAGALVGGAVWLGIILVNATWVMTTGDWIDYDEVAWPRRQPEEAALIVAGVTILVGGIAAYVWRTRRPPSRRR